ncbi:MAG TPA: hypothetical protein VN815_12740 [Steroidobacteraceae bacterium]|nr:hypothetical protein [Steroidobacteraceae bacterium]
MSGATAAATESSWFQRYLLPGFAFKAVVIGGGYATGRELAEFFLPSGPQGGLMAIVLAMVIWSAVCAVTFCLAYATSSWNYRAFFKNLLGPFWVIFEVCYLLFIVLILAVFGAAAGAIGAALLGWPPLFGTCCLIACISAVTAYGTASVEQLFKWVSIFLYAVYAIFVVLSFFAFGDRIIANLGAQAPHDGWIAGGFTYAGYNVVGAVIILPVLRHLRSRKNAVIAGVLAGPFAMLPALLFFVCMIAYYPQIGNEALPSDFLLRQLNFPAFHYLFQLMIFLALLESGTGCVHAFNERIAEAYAARKGNSLSKSARLWITGALLLGSIFLAARFGLVDLIAKGYRGLAYMFLAIFVLPVMTLGLRQLYARKQIPP